MTHLISVELTEAQFKKISQLVYRLCGIYLKEGKEALVRARLMKRLRALGMNDFETYLKYIESKEGTHELILMVDVITTNKTSFFREAAHFEYLRNHIVPELDSRKLRFWCAACSSGEEAFSLAITLRESIPDIEYKDVKILATDISVRMLEKARRAIYGEETVRDMPPAFLQKYFVKIQSESSAVTYQVKENIREMVRIARLNLIEPWPMKGTFNVIFCRNVMIYFDRVTQQNLINRFWDYLDIGCYLFVGHSEGLSAISHKFQYVRPAIYKKN